MFKILFTMTKLKFTKPLLFYTNMNTFLRYNYLMIKVKIKKVLKFVYNCLKLRNRRVVQLGG